MTRHAAKCVLLLSVIIFVGGLAASADALPGCVALGGQVFGAECRIQSALTASGAYEIENALTLHFINSVGSITTGGADLSIIVHGDLIMDGGTFIDASKPAGICNMGGAITLTPRT